MAPLRRWAPRGRRLHAKIPHGRWKTMTFLAALRHDRIDAPWFIEGPIDGVSFRTYVEKVLLPVLRPGDIVILDNLGSHRSKAVRQLIRSVGAKLFFLPKYSPDLNPIEQVFAKLKHLLHKAAAPTVDAVCTAIGHALDAFTWKEERTVSVNLTPQYDQVLFILEPTGIARSLARKRVTVIDYPDGRLAIRYHGVDLPDRTFDKRPQVNQAAIVENKRLGPILAYIAEQQKKLDMSRSAKAPRQRGQKDHMFKVA